MIFQLTWQAVLEGRKSQTRRLVVPELDTLQNGAVIRCGEPPRVRWKVGKDYAVQPGRGKESVARIEILSIRREDVRTISDADVKAEGFKTASDFFITWVKMHDKSVITPIIPDYHTGEIIWQGVHDYLSTRPAERYDAWAIEFEVVT